MADRIGQQISNYRLIRLLGSGAFGEVYLGEHVSLKRFDTIKVLPGPLESGFREHFFREARLLASLVHPNIDRFLDFGIENTTLYFVTEYAPGGSLRQRFPMGVQLNLAQAVSYVKQVASALQYLHDQGLVHRNVKPENMLLGARGEVLLSDFGIATLLHGSITSPSQEIAGTAVYMAPEQMQGKAGLASDQYSLAIVVYEWLTGRPPFQGTFYELVKQHLNASPPSLRSMNPSIPPAVEQVIMTALAKDPRHRFASVSEFATAFERAANPPMPLSISSSPASILSPAPPPPDILYSQSIEEDDYPTGSMSSDMASSSQMGTGALFPNKATPASPPPAQRSAPAGPEPQQQKELSLFAIARTTVDDNKRAAVGQIYKVEAGIAQNRPEGFQGEPIRVRTPHPTDPLVFDILIHPGDHVELLGAWYQRLRYNPVSAEPQFISCQFRLKAPGSGHLVVHFYRERQWLKAIRFEFEGVLRPQRTTAASGR